MPELELLAAAGRFVLAQSALAAVVFVVIAPLAGCLRRHGPALQLALWSLVFVRLVLPPGWSHPLALGTLAGMLGRLLDGPAAIHGAVDVGAGDSEVHKRAASEAGETGVAPTPAAAVGVAWLLGVAAVASVRARRWSAVRRIIRSARPVADPEVAELVARWRARLHVRRRIRVLSAPADLGPWTSGWLDPVVFLPSKVLAERRCLESVIAHELVHVAHWDAFRLAVQNVLQTVFFFHPAVWIAGGRCRDAAEQLCDARVLACGGISSRRYARSLVEVAGLDLAAAGALNLTTRNRRFIMRIRGVLEFDGSRRTGSARLVVAAGLLGAFVLPLADGTASSLSEPGTVPVVASSVQETGFRDPVPGGRVSWGWGPGRDPFTGGEVFHRGVDVAAAAGTPLLAPAAGTVTVATESYEPLPAAGTVIVIDHGEGLATSYSHLGTLLVAAGDAVVSGQQIAAIGSTGRSTGPHVHIEVLLNGVAVDPGPYLAAWVAAGSGR